jgi:hypothetical protein
MARRNVRTERKRVQLTHPSGRFTVEVSEARASTLLERGYTTGARGAGKPAEPAAAESKYASMKVPELQAELTRRYLEPGGKKAELVARLEADDADDDDEEEG